MSKYPPYYSSVDSDVTKELIKALKEITVVDKRYKEAEDRAAHAMKMLQQITDRVAGVRDE